ncbi:hypothetical protein [Caulobacter sp. AP07]|uniref:hypothetical protein n=1 Tax=Caulobacter sp. AP07 TaxID=1144304 RepID=UPI0012FA38F5|nr:hypothetical protein [Caulobacter sp. AP07]
MQDFYDGWDARMEECAAKTCGCPVGHCDVDEAGRKPREVFAADLDGDLPFFAPPAAVKEEP